MLAALSLALALQGPPPPPPVTHHFVFHTGGQAVVKVPARLRSWSVTRPNVASLRDVQSVKNRSSLRITANAPGSTAITVGCDGGHGETWLVDVR